ncbi:uncharacterized protein LOC108850083 [Raphanus sativus]|uniref:Uncharacterized protein LOC108850083 n=1 Tax=Raphanus sativus TaxID=3726 RepID=A0A6J0N3D7_RAPSA|nr:uncharacterized protein LOC108850083 [Raphanus sativus]
MTEITTFAPLTKLRPFKTNWRVQVKCLHSWRQNTSYGDTFEMVLADQWGNKVQATCKRTHMYRVQREIPVGKWGVIENCQMNPAGGQFRATRHPYKMSILDDTVVRGSSLSDDRIFLSLEDYENIGSKTQKEIPYLIDVIGRIHELGNVLTVKAQGEDRKRVEFRLMDSQGNDLLCCLWGPYAEQIEAFIDKYNETPVVCLLRFAKINFFRGEVQITNAFSASVLHLNPTEPEVLELTERLSNDHLQLAPVEKSTGKKNGKRIQYDWNDAEIKPISEVLASNQVGICKIICSVESIDTDYAWYYIGCNRHKKRVNKLPKIDYEVLTVKDKPMFRCEICNANVTHVAPMFKLHMVVKDDSETCNVMLLGSVATSIIGSKAEELWDGSYAEIEDPEILPEPIIALLGKSFCFGVSINSDNVTSGSSTFLVLEVSGSDKLLSIETDSDAITDVGTSSSTMSSGAVMMLDSISTEDPKTPYSKRKEDDADLQEQSSTSKKLCSKVIKQEKAKTE